MAQTTKFDIYHAGEAAAGIRGFSETVTVIVDNDAGGEKGEFEEYMRECLAEWFDGAKVTLEKEDNKQVMVSLNSTRFRCDCNGNVFTEYKPLRFRCNACGKNYIGGA